MFVPLKISEKEALKRISSERKGIINKEKIKNVSLFWIPVALLKIRTDCYEKLVTDKIVKTEMWNVYELLNGWWTGLTFSDEPKIDSNIGNTNNTKINKLNPRIKIGDVIRAVNSLKHEKNPVKLSSYGIPVNSVNVEVIDSIEAYYPFYIGALSKKKEVRYVSISGVSGQRCGIIERLVEIIFRIVSEKAEK